MSLTVGILRFTKELNDYTLSLLKLGYIYNVSVCSYFAPELQTECNHVPAVFWNGKELAAQEVSIPAITDSLYPLTSASVLDFMGREKVKWLQEHTYVVDHEALSKYQLMQVLMCSPYAQYAIPTYAVASHAQALQLTQMFRKTILKPIGGRLGMGVRRLTWKDEQCFSESQTGSSELTASAWEHYCAELKEAELGTPILQPCLNFSFDADHAVDFRLLTSRSAGGDWETVDIYARIGATGLVSNLSQGGYIGDAADILEIIAGERGNELLQMLHSLARELPPILQQHCKNPIAAFGIDVGIDRDTLQPYVLEANTYPGKKFHFWQFAEKRVQYYKHLTLTL